MRKPSQSVRLGYISEGFPYCPSQRTPRSGSYCSQSRLDLRPAFLNRGKVRRIGRQVYQLCSTRCDCFFNADNFVRTQIVHYNNVSFLQSRAKHALHIDPKNISSCCAFNGHYGIQTAYAQCSDHRHILAVVLGHASDGSFAAPSAAIESRQGNINAGFIYESETLNIKIAYLLTVVSTGLPDSGRISFTGVERLFFLGSPNA